MGLKIPSPLPLSLSPSFFFPLTQEQKRLLFPSPPPVSFVLLVPLPSSPRVRVFGWRIELWIHGKGGPSLLLTSERSILIQFAGSFWICLVLFSVSCACRSGALGKQRQALGARARGIPTAGGGAQERPLPALVGSRARKPRRAAARAAAPARGQRTEAQKHCRS